MEEEERPALSPTLGVLRSSGAGWGEGEEGRGKRGEKRGERRGKLGRQGDSGVIEVSSERTDYEENQE